MTYSDEKKGARSNVETERIQDLGSGKLSQSLVLAIADAAGLCPLEMEPLYAAIDPELINRLEREDPAVSADIMFDYHGFRVTVTSDRQTTFYPLGDDGTEPRMQSQWSESDWT